MRRNHADRIQRRRMLANRRTVTYVLCTMFSLAVASAASALDESDEQASGVGLRDILPVEVPDGLTDEAFAELDGKWAQWSAGVAAQVVKLYEDESLDVAAQRAVIATLKSKLGVLEEALRDERYELLFDPLISLHGKLERRVDLAEAVLDTLALDPKAVEAERLKNAGRDVLKALAELETDLNTIPNATPWLTYVKADKLSKAINNPAASDPVLAEVQQKLKTKAKLSKEQSDFLNRPAFAALEQSLDTLLAVANTPAKPVDEKKLRAELAGLIEALEAFEEDNLSGDAAKVNALVESIGQLVPDGGKRIDLAVRRHYINYNLQILASERFLSRLLYEEQIDQGKSETTSSAQPCTAARRRGQLSASM